jgi:hypothetical protein
MSIIAPGPRTDRVDPEALIEEAWQRAHRRRRRRIAALIGLLLVAVTAVAWAALAGGGTSGRAHRAGSAAGPAVRRGAVGYLYTRAVFASAQHAVFGAPAGGVTIENWVGSDGSWRLRETVPGSAPGSLDVVVSGDGLLPPQANAKAAFNGVPVNMRDPDDGLFTARELDSLPVRVSALRARLEQAVIAQELRNLDAYVVPSPHRAGELARLRHVFLANRDTDVLFEIADLEMSPLPGRLPAALYRVARALPGVRVTAARDSLGRPGVAVASGALTLIFAPRTGALRSDTTGAVFDQGTGPIIAQGPVPGLDAIPRGLTPIRSLVRQPPAITITPATGTRSTTFTVRLVARSVAATRRPPALAAQMFGPTGPNCIYWHSRPPLVRIGAGTIINRPHVTFVRYSISPAAIGHRAWCPGRYQLMLSLLHRSPGRMSVPRSFAATYFTAR